MNSPSTIIVVIFMLTDDFSDSDQKTFPSLGPVWLSQAAIIPGLADMEYLAQFTDLPATPPAADIPIQPLWFYFFRSLAKKPRASFKISLALRSSAFSRSNSISRWLLPAAT